MIIGAHVILYSTNAEADRAFSRDVLGFAYVDTGHGWLIFTLPPAEAAVHPSATGETHELFLMSDDLPGELRKLEAKGVVHGAVEDARWGLLVRLTLPGSGTLGLYQPRHELGITLARS